MTLALPGLTAAEAACPDPVLRVQEVAGLGDDALRQEWQRLAAQDDLGGFFAGPGFVSAFADQMRGRAAVALLTFREGERLVGVLPLMRCRVWRGVGLVPRHDYLAGDARLLRHRGRRWLPLRQISPLLGLEASVLSTRLVAAPAWRERIWHALPAALAGARGWDMAVFPISEPALLAATAGARAAGLPLALRRIDRPMQSLHPVLPSAGLIAAGSKKFRQNMRRAEKFAAESGAVIEVLDDDAARDALPAFADLAARSWKASDDSQRAQGEVVVVQYAGAQQHLAEVLARDARQRPVLAVARRDGQWRAACLAYATERTLTPFVMVQDAEAGRESFGHLVLHALIDHAAAQGLARVDYNANSAWVAPYVNEVAMVQTLALFRPGIAGRVLAALANRGGRAT